MVCIFLMVVGHWTSNPLILTYIYSFHMPALFVISGYLYKPHSWYSTIASFAVPVLFFSLMNLLFQLLLGDRTIESVLHPRILFDIIHYRYGLGTGLFMGDWFLWALIGLRFFFGDIGFFKPLKRSYLPIAILCVAYMTFESCLISIDTIFGGYYVGLMIPSFAFFSLGLWLKDREWFLKDVPVKYISLLLLLFVVLPLVNGKCSINSDEYGRSYLLFAINAALSSILLFAIAARIPSTKFVQTISKGTLIVLGSHMPILRLLGLLLPETLSFTFPFITIILCYYIIIACERYCPMLLGKSSSFGMSSGKSRSMWNVIVEWVIKQKNPLKTYFLS